MCSEDGHDGRRSARLRESSGILNIHHCAAREYHEILLFRDGNGKLLPVHEIFADGMPPAHVPPTVPKWIVLIEKVIGAVHVYESVRVVGPILFRCEMELRAPGLFICADTLLGDRLKDAGGEQNGKEYFFHDGQ